MSNCLVLRYYITQNYLCVLVIQAMYGGLHSFQGCKAHNELMATHKVKDWYLRMEDQIYTHQGASVLGSSPTRHPNYVGFQEKKWH